MGRPSFIRKQALHPFAGPRRDKANGGDGFGVSPFFSPDGRWVGFFADGKLKKVPLEGGPPIALSPSRNLGVRATEREAGSRWDHRFHAELFSGLRLISASGGEPRALTTPDARRLKSLNFPQILRTESTFSSESECGFEFGSAGRHPLS